MQQQPAQQEPATAQQGRGIQYGAHLIVPIWLSDPAGGNGESVDPGIGVQGRLGWEFPSGWSAEFDLGVMVNRVTFDSSLGLSDRQLDAVWLGAGLRYSLLNRTAWVPFLGVGLQLTGWGDDLCGGSSCSRKWTIGANGIVGLVLEVSQFLGLEVGVQVMASSEGEVFKGVQIIVSPLAGITLYY